jgi:hypothetical protein
MTYHTVSGVRSPLDLECRTAWIKAFSSFKEEKVPDRADEEVGSPCGLML